ncbi:uncharacterized protein LOC122638750 [Telopea speciosissima]|uniref:uncharacterized protein LOC122638750 n=1 Tax=Telopea speciosissima TaxID=54955 RepID=UPI001CC3E696|nr:uncharacterized protein LOC122638750 [Telopea speciosissima]
MHELLVWWKEKADSSALAKVWLAGFILVPFHIWSERNRRRFEGSCNRSGSVLRLLKLDLRDASTLMKCFIKSMQDLVLARDIGASFPIAQARRIIEVQWRKPEENWMKLNTDGCSIGNLGHSSAAGILRNCQGHPKGSFAQYLGVSTNFTAKFSTFFLGVQMAREKGIQKLWIV